MQNMLNHLSEVNVMLERFTDDEVDMITGVSSECYTECLEMLEFEWRDPEGGGWKRCSPQPTDNFVVEMPPNAEGSFSTRYSDMLYERSGIHHRSKEDFRNAPGVRKRKLSEADLHEKEKRKTEGSNTKVQKSSKEKKKVNSEMKDVKRMKLDESRIDGTSVRKKDKTTVNKSHNSRCDDGPKKIDGAKSTSSVMKSTDNRKHKSISVDKYCKSSKLSGPKSQRNLIDTGFQMKNASSSVNESEGKSCRLSLDEDSSSSRPGSSLSTASTVSRSPTRNDCYKILPTSNRKGPEKNPVVHSEGLDSSGKGTNIRSHSNVKSQRKLVQSNMLPTGQFKEKKINNSNMSFEKKQNVSYDLMKKTGVHTYSSAGPSEKKNKRKLFCEKTNLFGSEDEDSSPPAGSLSNSVRDGMNKNIKLKAIGTICNESFSQKNKEIPSKMQICDKASTSRNRTKESAVLCHSSKGLNSSVSATVPSSKEVISTAGILRKLTDTGHSQERDKKQTLNVSRESVLKVHDSGVDLDSKIGNGRVLGATNKTQTSSSIQEDPVAPSWSLTDSDKRNAGYVRWDDILRKEKETKQNSHRRQTSGEVSGNGIVARPEQSQEMPNRIESVPQVKQTCISSDIIPASTLKSQKSLEEKTGLITETDPGQSVGLHGSSKCISRLKINHQKELSSNITPPSTLVEQKQSFDEQADLVRRDTSLVKTVQHQTEAVGHTSRKPVTECLLSLPRDARSCSSRSSSTDSDRTVITSRSGEAVALDQSLPIASSKRNDIAHSSSTDETVEFKKRKDHCADNVTDMCSEELDVIIIKKEHIEAVSERESSASARVSLKETDSEKNVKQGTQIDHPSSSLVCAGRENEKSFFRKSIDNLFSTYRLLKSETDSKKCPVEDLRELALGLADFEGYKKKLVVELMENDGGWLSNNWTTIMSKTITHSTTQTEKGLCGKRNVQIPVYRHEGLRIDNLLQEEDSSDFVCLYLKCIEAFYFFENYERHIINLAVAEELERIRDATLKMISHKEEVKQYVPKFQKQLKARMAGGKNSISEIALLIAEKAKDQKYKFEAVSLEISVIKSKLKEMLKWSEIPGYQANDSDESDDEEPSASDKKELTTGGTQTDDGPVYFKDESVQTVEETIVVSSNSCEAVGSESNSAVSVSPRLCHIKQTPRRPQKICLNAENTTVSQGECGDCIPGTENIEKGNSVSKSVISENQTAVHTGRSIGINLPSPVAAQIEPDLPNIRRSIDENMASIVTAQIKPNLSNNTPEQTNCNTNLSVTPLQQESVIEPNKLPELEPIEPNKLPELEPILSSFGSYCYPFNQLNQREMPIHHVQQSLSRESVYDQPRQTLVGIGGHHHQFQQQPSEAEGLQNKQSKQLGIVKQNLQLLRQHEQQGVPSQHQLSDRLVHQQLLQNQPSLQLSAMLRQQQTILQNQQISSRQQQHLHSTTDQQQQMVYRERQFVHPMNASADIPQIARHLELDKLPDKQSMPPLYPHLAPPAYTQHGPPLHPLPAQYFQQQSAASLLQQTAANLAQQSTTTSHPQYIQQPATTHLQNRQQAAAATVAIRSHYVQQLPATLSQNQQPAANKTNCVGTQQFLTVSNNPQLSIPTRISVNTQQNNAPSSHMSNATNPVPNQVQRARGGGQKKKPPKNPRNKKKETKAASSIGTNQRVRHPPVSPQAPEVPMWEVQTVVDSNCIVCQQQAQMQCSGCFKVKYCGILCQNVDWNRGHSKACCT